MRCVLIGNMRRVLLTEMLDILRRIGASLPASPWVTTQLSSLLVGAHHTKAREWDMQSVAARRCLQSNLVWVSPSFLLEPHDSLAA
jgi:hypothetical protein